MQTIHGFSPSQQTLTLFFRLPSATKKNPLYSNNNNNNSSPLPIPPLIRRNSTNNKSQNLSVKPNLKRLTSRIVELTRRKQLHQIFEEVEFAKRRYGKLNTIVMNAVMEACVHCGDIDSAFRVFQEMLMPESCGVDSVTFGTLLKGLGEARRIDEAFQLLESMEQGTIVGSPKLSPTLIYGLLNALIEAGDLRRANGLLARYHFVLREGGPSIQMYNLLMKGYINAGFPQDALTVHDEILRKGLKTDRCTYNTLVFACVKSGRMDSAMRLFAEMKDEAQKIDRHDLFPDVVTYTTLLKGFGHAKDLHSVLTIVMEMKSLHDLFIDRVAYTAIIDALLNCGSTKSALCIFGEIQKQSGGNPVLRPKPHLYLSLMRTFALRGDYNMVKSLRSRMWPDTAGVISTAVQVEADELLMEAATNYGQVDVARQILSNIVTKWESMSWTSRGSMVAVRVEALSGFTRSTFSPYLLPQVSLDDPIETIMRPFEEARPLLANLDVKNVPMRFFRDEVVPIIDEWGSCVGIVHREDCNQLNTSLSSVMRSPPRVTTSTSIGRVIELLLEKRYKMIIIVKPPYEYGQTGGYRSNLRAVGVFTSEQLFKLAVPQPVGQEPCICRTST
ncbi:CBS domain [Macleaya cordata]|uniref:CBS domain n=1 Tax=Macleaya cordata TaxID=56857 RepID=A0A200QIF3_MACCD|nr:CBS domain [Macleaya cordata]